MNSRHSLQTYSLTGFWLITILALTISCRTATKKPHTSEVKGGSDPNGVASIIDELDVCGPWRVHLATTIYGYVLGDPEQYKDTNYNISKTLTASKGREIIDTIINQENNICATQGSYSTLQAIYEKPTCSVKTYFNIPIPPDYFEALTDFHITKERIQLLDRAINIYYRRATKTFNEEKIIQAFSYNNSTQQYMFLNTSNFGVCMILKHKRYLAQQNIFDFDPHLSKPASHGSQVTEYDGKSLNKFIKKTNEITGATTPFVANKIYKIKNKQQSNQSNTQNHNDTTKNNDATQKTSETPNADVIQPADPNL